MNHTKEKCRLELILGPMMSGKSTELQRRLRVKSVYKTVLAVNTKKDIRYGNDGIITHDGQKMHSVRVTSLIELVDMNEYKSSEVIGIDEGQFFPNIFAFVTSQLRSSNKTFIISGLIGDKDKKLFGNIYKLLPHAEFIDFKHAICKRCGDGSIASFTATLVKFEGQEHIGSSETYESVCRDHYNEIQLRNSK